MRDDLNSMKSQLTQRLEASMASVSWGGSPSGLLKRRRDEPNDILCGCPSCEIDCDYVWLTGLVSETTSSTCRVRAGTVPSRDPSASPSVVRLPRIAISAEAIYTRSISHPARQLRPRRISGTALQGFAWRLDIVTSAITHQPSDITRAAFWTRRKRFGD